MPSPICQVKDGAGAYQGTTNGVDVTPGNTITIRLVDSSANSWSISCATTDDLSVAATVNASLTIDPVAKTATFTAPTAGRAYRFRSQVNGGIGPDGRPITSYTTTFCVYTLVNSNRVIAADETFEGDPTFGWLKSHNAIVRSGGGAAVSGTGFAHYTSGILDANAKAVDLTSSLDVSGQLPFARLAGQGTGVVHSASGVMNITPVVDADVSASAAIAGTKVTPAFGSQPISTTGTLASGAATISTSLQVGTGTDFMCVVRPLVSFPTSNGAFYCLPPGTTLTSGNCTVYGDGGSSFLNAPSASGYAGLSQAGGNATLRAYSTRIEIPVPTKLIDVAALAAGSGFSSIHSNAGAPKVVDADGNTAWLSTVLVRRSSNTTTTAATATAMGLSFAVASGEVWVVEATILAQCSTTSGVKYQLVGPASSNFDGGHVTSFSAAGALVYATFLSSTLVGPVHTASGAFPDRIACVVTAGAAGTISLSFASNTAGDTTTIYSGSFLRAQRIA